MVPDNTNIPWLAGLVGLVGLIVSQASWSASAREDLVQQNLAPIGQVNVAGASAATKAASAPPSGEAIYNKICMACHTTGVSGAPILGDKAAWSPRIGLGEEALIQAAIKGVKAMPPKGGCMSCSDADIKAAVDYMIKKSS